MRPPPFASALIYSAQRLTRMEFQLRHIVDQLQSSSPPSLSSSSMSSSLSGAIA